MKLPVILLFLQLWGNVEVSSSQNVCSRLPRVPHAFVSSDTTKYEYQQGDVIHFTCERGYTSSQISKYVCASEGWLAVRQGTCYSCSALPDVPHARVSEETKKNEYREGDMIHFTCEPGYTSGQTSRYACTRQGWLAASQGTCYIAASSCDPPPADGGITIKGLPENNDPIVPDQIITFSCDGLGKYLSGSSVLICGEDGQWNNPFPSCKDVTCKLGAMHRQLFVARLPPGNETMTVGHKLRFQCNNPYSLEGSEEIECLATGQWNAPFPTCAVAASSCDPPPADGGITIKGLPENNDPIVPDQIITFSCDGLGKYLSGSSVLICGEDGQWNNPFPSCKDVTCKLGAMHRQLFVAGLPPGNETMTVGHKLRFQCNDPYSLEGSEEIECLATGQWNAPFPTCADGCQIPRVITGIRITNHVPNSQLKIGDSLKLACHYTWHFLRGNATITCLADGRWSEPFPTCGGPAGCERPPALDNGDTRLSVQNWYRHGENVEYVCQNLYTMQGGPYKTCINGKWTGELRCLKPCIVNEDIKRAHNIDFRYSSDSKVYAAHNDHITFTCISGTTPDGKLPMRQKCVDGVLHFPTCH